MYMSFSNSARSVSYHKRENNAFYSTCYSTYHIRMLLQLEHEKGLSAHGRTRSIEGQSSGFCRHESKGQYEVWILTLLNDGTEMVVFCLVFRIWMVGSCVLTRTGFIRTKVGKKRSIVESLHKMCEVRFGQLQDQRDRV